MGYSKSRERSRELVSDTRKLDQFFFCRDLGSVVIYQLSFEGLAGGLLVVQVGCSVPWT
jgi:hypothetical protein